MGYHQMDDDEWRAFLVGEPRPAVLATTRPDGRPHAAPVWFDLDGEEVVFMTGVDTVKGRNLAADPHVALCVQDDRPPFSFVLIEGTATLSDDPDSLLLWGTRIGGRYMGADRADEYGRRNGVPGELLVRVGITNVVAARDVAS